MQVKNKKCIAINEISKQPTFVHFFEMSEAFCQIFDLVFWAKDETVKISPLHFRKKQNEVIQINLIYDVITENCDNKFRHKR